MFSDAKWIRQTAQSIYIGSALAEDSPSDSEVNQ